MNCPHCRKELMEGAQFCIYCGTSVQPTRDTRAESVETVRAEREVESNGDEEDEKTVVVSDSLRGQVLDGKYELIERLGEGGMGAVYRARRVHIGDEVAVKILHPKYLADEAAVSRFRREARAAAQLHHPNVVTIHDYGETEAAGESLAYIVMELVSGVSLRDLLRSEGKLDPHRAVWLMRDICAGVGSAHRRQIVHRDIKPDNIIVVAPDEDRERETVKVVDFGIAKLRDMAATDRTLTLAGAVLGTPFYMSPEQCLGESLDARADVYSLGALLYEMLAGTPPFSAPTATGVIAKHLSEAPPRIPTNISITPALATTISRALSKDPEGRQRDASEFARELIASEAGAPFATVKIAPGQTPDGAPLARQVEQRPLNPNASQQRDPAFDTPTAYMPGAPPISLQQTPPARQKSRAGLYVSLFVMLVILAGAGLGAYLILSDRDRRSANAAGNVAQNTATNRPASNTNAKNANARATDAPPFQRAEAKILNDAPLAEADLAGLSPSDLRFLLNTVYARHGRIFASPELDTHFRSRPWYRPRQNMSDDMLSDTDRANARLLSAAGGGSVGEARPDPEVARTEVSAALEGWAEATRAHDLDAHMSFYADTLETYYNASDVGHDRVRSDRGQAFDRYHTLNVQLSNIKITLDETGASAQVTLDKAWRFDGERCSQGKVQQLLKLARVEGRWRITGEKDLMVYPDTEDDCD